MVRHLMTKGMKIFDLNILIKIDTKMFESKWKYLVWFEDLNTLTKQFMEMINNNNISCFAS